MKTESTTGCALIVTTSFLDNLMKKMTKCSLMGRMKNDLLSSH